MIEDIYIFYITFPNVFLVTIGLTSLFIGSFLNVVIYRLPRMMHEQFKEECHLFLGLANEQLVVEKPVKLNLAFPSSHCTDCKTPIRPWHNIPIISYCWLRGKCAACHTNIHLRYPLVEALTMIASLIVASQFGVSTVTLAALCFTWIAICLSFIDIEYHLLPDQLTLFLLWVGLFFNIFNIFCSPQDAILGAIAGYLIFAVVQFCYFLIMKKTGLGQGDFKYLAAIGAFLGWQLLPFVILLASITGVIITFVTMLIKRQMKSVPLPFGPYLAFAGWVALLWGGQFMHTALVY